MEIRVAVQDVTAYKGDALVVNLFEGVERPGGAAGAVDRALDGAIARLIKEGEIKGKLNERALLHTFGKIPAERVLVIGLGKQAEFTLDRVRSVAAESLKHLRKVGARRVGTVVHGAGAGGLAPAGAAQALAEGALLGLYTFERYKTKKEEEGKAIDRLTILEREAARAKELERGAVRGRVLAEATNLARDLVNEPGNTLTPTELANRARAVARACGLECKVLGPEEMRRLGMGALLGVAQGSRQPPRVIVLRHKGGRRRGGPCLGLVGKGVTFDSGGISIKPAENMEAMKGDMAGGAAVIGAMKAIAELRVPLDVIGVVPATENLPSGTALKPGDILKSMSGKTIEVINTDAEGRLILADGLAYARKQGATHLVNAATLTGACVVALGAVRTGVFSNNQEWAGRVMRAAEAAGERVWQMPMDEEYDEQIKSDVADIKNTGGRKGGAITAAKFLQHFVGETPWVHLDIAGTSDSDKDKDYRPKGATGVMARTFVNLAAEMAGITPPSPADAPAP